MRNLTETTAARRLPVHARADVGREVSLREDVVGDVRQTLAGDRVTEGVELDALSRRMRTGAVGIDVADPEGSRDVG